MRNKVSSEANQCCNCSVTVHAEATSIKESPSNITGKKPIGKELPTTNEVGARYE